MEAAPLYQHWKKNSYQRLKIDGNSIDPSFHIPSRGKKLRTGDGPSNVPQNLGSSYRNDETFHPLKFTRFLSSCESTINFRVFSIIFYKINQKQCY